MKINKFVLISVIIIILGIGLVVLHDQGLLSNNASLGSENNASAVREVLANNSEDPGTVEVIRNVGNPNGKKIAYVVGLHPLEHETHETLVKLLPTIDNLNYSYDIYIINVTEDVGYYGDGSSDNSQGRQNGQNLAYKYVYPQIVDGNYELAIDVHSNVGAYPYKTFVFSPLTEGLGEKYASDVAGKCENITYYQPDSTTSGPYLTIPLNENGIPAFYYEEYSFATQNEKDVRMLQLINAVDSLSL
jgi:hypothetical protein